MINWTVSGLRVVRYRSVIIRVITKSHDREAGVRFVKHDSTQSSYQY